MCGQVVEILQKLYSSGADDLGMNFINELTVRFCHCPKWVGRQAFAFICQVCGEKCWSGACPSFHLEKKRREKAFYYISDFFRAGFRSTFGIACVSLDWCVSCRP